MGAPLQWIENIFRRHIIRDLNGNNMPDRSAVKFVATCTDDPANDQTIVQGLSFDPIVHLLTSAANGPTYTVNETDGDVRLSIRALTAAFTVDLPANPTVGMRVGVKAADATFSAAFSITVNGSGHNVEWEGASTATFLMTPATVGNGANMFWMWDGTAWVSQ